MSANLAQNPPYSSSSAETRKPILPILAVVIALTALLAGVAEDLALKSADNQNTFMSMAGDWESYLELRQEWRPRDSIQWHYGPDRLFVAARLWRCGRGVHADAVDLDRGLVPADLRSGHRPERRSAEIRRSTASA